MVLSLSIASSCSAAEDGTRGTADDVAALAASDWPFPNYDAAATRATFATSIDSGTVADLAEVWRYELAPGIGTGAAPTTPIVIDDVVYLGDIDTNVHAIDLGSGERLWMAEGAGATFGPTGVAVGGGRVFANHAGRGVAAYAAGSGELEWQVELTEAGGVVNIQPVVAGEHVLAATSALAQPGSRGVLFALAADDGEIEWSFDTIVSEDLWGHPEINSGGGAWYPPAVDLATGISYWGTSNPYPFPGAEGYPNGSSRPGDNRWTNSTLAIDLDGGDLVWGYQALPHDLFDRDTVLTALVDTDGDGVNDVVIGSGKLGRVFGLSVEGRLLWDTPVGMHQNDDIESFDGELEVLPGATGGVITPLAVADGLVYVAVVNAPITYTGPELSSSGAETALSSFDGQLVAIDTVNGDIVWDVAVPGDPFGGTTVANDLVFTSVLDGLILAFDRATGEEVWRYSAPGGINGWPAIGADSLVIPVSYGEPPVLLALAL
jgi:outer membrane protein assembly factor BamB